jgi:hypothetical protein
MNQLWRLSSLLSLRVFVFFVIICSLPLAHSSCSRTPDRSRSSQTAQPATQISQAGQIAVPSFANVAEDGQWTMPAQDYASTRYSGLDEITSRSTTRSVKSRASSCSDARAAALPTRRRKASPCAGRARAVRAARSSWPTAFP